MSDEVKQPIIEVAPEVLEQWNAGIKALARDVPTYRVESVNVPHAMNAARKAGFERIDADNIDAVLLALAERKADAPAWNGDAPYSGNVTEQIGGRRWQLTIRANDLRTLIARAEWMNRYLDKQRPAGIELGQVAPQFAPMPAGGVPLPPQPQVMAQPTGAQESQCVLIEVGMTRDGSKLQLRFTCNGLDRQLNYSKGVNDMAQLVAPIGLTPAHLVNGQKYAIGCIVKWQADTRDGKTYRNVIAVRPA